METRRQLRWTAAMAVAALLALPVQAQIAVKNQGFVPFSDAPIHYRSDDLHDPVAKLQQALASGQVQLRHDGEHGYLKSVLDLLKISTNSQTLVFSKTSFQFKKITPELPRAMYFNDDVYVGQVHDGKVLEFVSFDPMQGAIFYILDEQKQDKPKFERAELDCTQCHVAPATRNVPGVFVKSIFTKPTGTQMAHSPTYITGQESPLSERWGGWYVTGTHGSQTHMGNVLAEDPENPTTIDRAAGSNVVDLAKRINTGAFLDKGSDIVAHLVLDHQTQMHNLITLTNYRARIATYEHAEHDKAAGTTSALTAEERKKYETPAEELVRYLLFANEAPFTGPVRGSSDYAKDFASIGPRDPKGRSLRDFDLNTRTFRYPCSYLIYSEAFDAIPEPAKAYVYHRLLEILTGTDQRPDYARLSAQDRRAILEILLATKPGLPDEWRSFPIRAQK